MAGMIYAEETSYPSGNEDFVTTRRGLAAMVTAGHAVAVVQGHGGW